MAVPSHRAYSPFLSSGMPLLTHLHNHSLFLGLKEALNWIILIFHTRHSTVDFSAGQRSPDALFLLSRELTPQVPSVSWA